MHTCHPHSLTDYDVNEEEDAEQEAEACHSDGPASIHLPEILASAAQKRKGGRKTRVRHAAGSVSYSLPHLFGSSNQIDSRRHPKATPGLPHLRPTLSDSSQHHFPTHLSTTHLPASPSNTSFHHGLPAALQVAAQQPQQVLMPPSYVPPLSPMSIKPRSHDGRGQATARESAAPDSLTKAALSGSVRPSVNVGAAPADEGQVMSSVTAAALAEAEGAVGGESAAGATGVGSEMDEIDTLLAAIGADMEQPGDDGALAARLESLPCTLCTSASGEMYMVGLGDVQHMLHKRKLGAEGLAILQRFENSVVKPMDAMALKRGVIRDAQRPSMVSIQVPPQKSSQAQARAGSGQLPTQAALQGLEGNRPKSQELGEAGGSESKENRSSVIGGASSFGEGLLESSTVQPSREDSGIDAGGIDEELIDEEVRRHLDQVMQLVEVHRSFVHHNNARTLAEQERIAATMNQAVKTQAAIDFIVKRLVPEKLIAMARTRRLRGGKGNGGSGAKPSLLKGLKNPEPSRYLSEGGLPVDESLTEPHRKELSIPSLEEAQGLTEEGAARLDTPPPVIPDSKVVENWDTAVSKVTMDKMPFMANWGAAIKKLRKDESPSWDEMSTSNQLSFQGGAKGNQGAQVYIVKCQELGVVPSTQVIQQLRQAESDMAHCKLGRGGAQALRYALALNTCITDLNLTDNGLDAQGLSEIVQGLTYGFTTKKLQQGLSSAPHQNISLDLTKMASSNDESNNNIIPTSLRDQVKPDSHQLSSLHKPTLYAHQPGTFPTSPPPTNRQNKFGTKGNLLSEQPEASPEPPEASSPKRLTSSTRKKKSVMRMQMEPHRSNVQVLNLSFNPLGVNGGRIIADLIDPSVTHHQFLVELRLVKCGLSEASGLSIVRALQHFNQTLKVLSLSNNAIGNKSAAAFGELLEENTTLIELDLSWNQIKSEGVKGLCKGLEGSVSLKRLVLAWNGLENEGAVRLGEMLINNASLIHLDLSNTRLGSEACVMIGEGIKANSTLEELLLNANAIGDDGVRHLIAALKSNKSLECLSLQGSNMSTAARGHNGAAEFNPLAPEGSYTLALDDPTDRTVAVQLCKFDAMSARGPLIHNVKLNDQSMRSIRDMDWPAKLPVSGLLEFDFVARKVQNMAQVMDNKKFQAVVFQLDSRSMSDVEKLSLVEIIAPFTYLYCHQVASILKCFSTGDELVRAAALLFTRAADLEENIDALTSVMQEHDIRSLQRMLGWFSYCRFSNPTGHYELNLTTSVHQAFAVRLKDVAYGEPNEGSNWFNIVYDMYSQTIKVPSNYGPPDSWKGVVPSRGTVSLDYVTTTRPPPEAQTIDDEELMDFLRDEIGMMLDDRGEVVPEPDFSTADMQVALLRQEAGHRFWFTCAQVQRVAHSFSAGPHKVEVIVMLWALILDRKNFWIILYSLPPFEQSLLMWRLGPLTVLDKAHPSLHYVLDLSNNLHEQVARRLIDMAAKNPDVPNFWNLRLQGVKKSMPEGSNMWGTLTAESFTPWLEFDFIYLDAWDSGVLGKSRAEIEAMGKFDKLELLSKHAKRIELQRIKAMYGYFYDGSGYTPPMWRTRSQMFKALLEKSPWLAAWDRLMRLLVRLDLRSGDIVTDSCIEDIFESRCSDEGYLTQEGFEAICRDWGYSRGEVHFHFRRAFELAAKPVMKTSSAAAESSHCRTHFSYLPSSRGTPAPVGSTGGLAVAAHNAVRSSETGDGSSSVTSVPSSRRVHNSLKNNMSIQEDCVKVVYSPIPDDPNEEAPASQKGDEAETTSSAAELTPQKALPTKADSAHQEKTGPVMVVDFATFVSIFMQEPSPELRFKEVAQISLGGAPMMSKTRGMSRKVAADKISSRPHSATRRK